jgi:acetyl-CoA acetyltransferase
VLCFTSFTQAGRPAARVQSLTGRIAGELRWQLPFGAATPVHWIGLTASHYLHRYGLDRSVFAGVAIAARQHAARNPCAIYPAPLTREEHHDARIVSTPFGLYDCDVPCDGAMAVIVSARETARDLRQPPVYVEAAGTQITEHQSWDQGSLTHQRNVFGPAAHLWTRTDLHPADVDVACLYDGFTFNVFSWLEALGFCAPGEAADFIAGGTRIGPGGALPLNPHGGQLAAGRSNGHGHVLEAVTQLRGQAAARQVANARLAVVSAGGGIPAGCFLLRND